MKRTIGLAKNRTSSSSSLSSLFGFSFLEWFNRNIEEASENFKKTMASLQEETAKLSEQLKTKESVEDWATNDNLLSVLKNLSAHQKLVYQAVDLLDKETNVEKNYKIVILKNLINSHFLWTEISETFKQRKNELQIDPNVDYPSENFATEWKSWIDILEGVQPEELYKKTEEFCKICPDEQNSLRKKHKKNYFLSIKEFATQFFLSRPTYVIKELEECLKDNGVDYEQLDEEYKFKERIGNISHGDLQEYLHKTSNYIESKKKNEPEILKSIELQYQNWTVGYYKKDLATLLNFKSIKEKKGEGELFSFSESAFDGVDGVPCEGNQPKFEEGVAYQLTFSDFVETKMLDRQIISSIIGEGKNIKKIAKTEKSKITRLTFKENNKELNTGENASEINPTRTPGRSDTTEAKRNWKKRHIVFNNFTPELQAEWEGFDFTYEQTKDWLNSGLTPYDAKLAAWLRANGLDNNWVLTYGDYKSLQEACRADTYTASPAQMTPSTPNMSTWDWEKDNPLGIYEPKNEEPISFSHPRHHSVSTTNPTEHDSELENIQKARKQGSKRKSSIELERTLVF